ncbi:MAG: formate/nitrite transporter family protein [Bacteroidales bacterium]|nr:formate/nitrite transporter family protein [Bacteroidales bacterium]
MVKQLSELKSALNKPKRVDEIFDEQIEMAMHEHRRSNRDLFMSAVSAGLEIGFTVFLMAAVYTKFHGLVNPSILDVLLAISYPLGFIFVVIGRSELFTEHTTLAVLPVLNKDATIKSLLVLWLVIYAGNLLGGYIFSAIMAIIPERLGAVEVGSFESLAFSLIDHPWYIITGSAILAGWLMGLLSWLVTASQETISRILIIALITTVIGIGGLHHCIVGSIEVFTAALTSKSVGMGEYLHVQIWSTLGNIIGGVVFVAFAKFSHVRYNEKRG